MEKSQEFVSINISMRILELFESVAKTPVVFYGGRFQPMHKGHFGVYKHLVNKFGVDNVFIATMFGKKQQQAHAAGDYSTDPFTFQEKADIIATMYGVPKDHVVETMPYRPDISKIGRDPATNYLVLALGDKDAARLGSGNVIQDYQENMLPEPNMDPETGQVRAYKYTVPSMEGGMNASQFRSDVKSAQDLTAMREKFDDYFGGAQQNPNSRNRIFDMVVRSIRK